MKQWFVLFLLLILPAVSFGQSDFSAGINSGPELSINPTYPNPGQEFTVTLSDSRSAAQGASLSWYQDNQAVSVGNASRNFTATAPAAGDSTTVSVVLNLIDGQTERYTKTITPVYLDIIVDPQTHVPAFYQGRALPSMGSQVNATAIVSNGTNILNKDYIYTWRVNNKTIGDGPLRGWRAVSFTAPHGNNFTLSLEVSQTDGKTIAKRAISVPIVRPELHFYERNALYGIVPRSLERDFAFISPTVTVRAEPYHLDSNIFNSPDLIEWEINKDLVLSSDPNPYDITLQKTGALGDASLSFRVQSTTAFLQGARQVININL